MNKMGDVKQRSLSLFRPVPASRSCEQVHFIPFFCLSAKTIVILIYLLFFLDFNVNLVECVYLWKCVYLHSLSLF